MSFDIQGVDITRVAGEDLSDYQYHVVVLNSSGQAILPNAATDVPFGVLQNAPESGTPARIRPIGCGAVSKCVVGGSTITVGTSILGLEYIGATDAGKVKPAASTQYPIGLPLEATTAEDDVIAVLLTPLTVVA